MKIYPKLESLEIKLWGLESEDIEKAFKGISYSGIIKHYGVLYSSLKATH